MSQHNDMPANSGSSSIQRIPEQFESEDYESPQIRADCLHTLYLTNPQQDREEILTVKGAITPGTCSWILSSVEYTQWHQRNPRSGNILWICGGPGSGKTMLAIFLSKHLEDTNAQGAAQSHLAGKDSVFYFHCNGSETTKSSETGILRGLLFQAICQRPSFLGYVQQLFESQGYDVSQHWSFDLLWAALRQFVLGQSAENVHGSNMEDTSNHRSAVVYIVLDGLDECEPASIRNLVRKLSRLDEDKELGGRTKVMVFGREKPVLRDAFAGRCHQLNLEEPRNAQAVFADVQQHIVQQVDDIASPDKKDYSTELCNSIKDRLAQNSRANFLWVSMVMNELKSPSRVEAWEHLSRLPLTLDAMYGWTIMQIPHEWRELSTKVLLWVTLAARPLSLAELVVALDERRLGLAGPETVRDCINRCGQILRIAADDRVHLTHHSARDYLLERLESSPSFFKDCVELNPFNLKEGHKLIASICIENVRGASQPGIRDLPKQEKGRRGIDIVTFSTSTPTALSDYAKAFWIDHVRNAKESMLDIVDSNPQLFEEHSPIRGILAYEDSGGLLTEDIPVLHYAAYYGFESLVGRLLKKGLRNMLRARRLVAQKDGLGRTALHLAVHRRDNGPVVELLLDRGADVSLIDSMGATPLDHAIKHGSVEIAEFLAAYGNQH